ncbi:MAG: anhydro-N-acetylmuramic acid kinase [Bacteroidetes bacterium]|nr:anhydro-N-acetylmuramic acid kinase [Bacteroidota bacterium]
MLINEKSTVIKAIGLMSGTSLDGVDLAACTFSWVDEKWTFTTEAAETYSYSSEWLRTLQTLHLQSAPKIFEADALLGRYYAELINIFIKKNNLQPDLIASHGHTLFHQPSKHFTTQIGSGAHISAITGYDTICDFRSKDVAFGGQGAPLVPVGDHYLFSEYEACLNLGGIANISRISEDGRRIAYDICPVNMALNELAQRVGKPFDQDGVLARSGTVIPEVLNQLNALPFYQQEGAKSLGREWYEMEFSEHLQKGKVEDVSRTVVEHIAHQHRVAFDPISPNGKILVTGGGAFHQFLLERIKELSNKNLLVPEKKLVNFKEAIVFAFLGVLNYVGKVNVFDSATGSVKQHVGGAKYRGDRL